MKQPASTLKNTKVEADEHRTAKMKACTDFIEMANKAIKELRLVRLGQLKDAIDNQEASRDEVTEFRMLDYLARHPGRVFSRDHLLDAVWGHDRAVTDRTVDVYILRLRQKIEPDTTNPGLIRAVRGTDKKLQMPPKKQLSAEQIAYLERWIKDWAAWPQPRAFSGMSLMPWSRPSAFHSVSPWRR